MATKKITKNVPSKKSAPNAPLKAGKPSSTTPKPRGTAKAPTGNKLDRIQSALATPDGATLAALMEVTGWQAHSVRGAMAGALKVKRGLSISSEVRDGVRFYRIEGHQ